MTDLLEPWKTIENQRRPTLEKELERELPLGHALAGKSVRAVAIRVDRDDVLFEVLGGGYAVVHLTWAATPCGRIFPKRVRSDYRVATNPPNSDEILKFCR